MDFDKTPSFYNDSKYFNRYLGLTSYYLAFQDIFSKLIGLVKPDKVCDLGCALGTSLSLWAKAFPQIKFTGIDFRKNVIEQCNMNNSLVNLEFTKADMCEFVKQSLDCDMITMLYSFHHIEDPDANKIDFLKNCFSNMKDNSYLLIGETFLPEEFDFYDTSCVKELWKRRGEEAFNSVYFKALEGLSSNDVMRARFTGTFAQIQEVLAGNHVIKRDHEFLVFKKWLTDIAKDIGFKVVLDKYINSFNDGIVLLKKEVIEC